jgi:hypothetical protein
MQARVEISILERMEIHHQRIPVEVVMTTNHRGKHEPIIYTISEHQNKQQIIRQRQIILLIISPKHSILEMI